MTKRLEFIVATLVPALAVVAFEIIRFGDGAMSWDFYPLRFGAEAWLRTGNAYLLDPPAPFRDFAIYRAGNPYPMPAVLLGLPFARLSPHATAIAVAVLLVVLFCGALRLTGLPQWYLCSPPVLSGLTGENYTMFILVAQIVALWAYRERRWWTLAFCGAFILTKPNQGLFFVLVLLILSRQWWRSVLAFAALWGATLLLDPRWPVAWLHALAQYRSELSSQPIYWWLALGAIPLLLIRDYVTGAMLLQFLVLPYPDPYGIYPVAGLPLAVLQDRRSLALVVLGYLWAPFALLTNTAWMVAVIFVLPVIILSTLRWWEQRRRGDAPAAPSSDPVAALAAD